MPDGSGRFPSTRYSAIAALGAPIGIDRQRALEVVASVYWRPIYLYLQVKWKKDPELAKDLTQAFFATAIDKDYFRSFDRTRAKFRTFLRTCVDRFILNDLQNASRLKRGGGNEYLPLEAEWSADEIQAGYAQSQRSPEDAFEQEWVRSLLEEAVCELKTVCESQNRHIHYTLFEQYDLSDLTQQERPTYAALAELHELAVTDVTNYLAAVRRQFREIVLERIRSLTVSDEEFREEVQAVLGVRTK